MEATDFAPYLQNVAQDRSSEPRYVTSAVDPSAAKEVVPTTTDAATLLIGIAMLVIAFTTLVLKIIEVARHR